MDHRNYSKTSMASDMNELMNLSGSYEAKFGQTDHGLAKFCQTSSFKLETSNSIQRYVMQHTAVNVS